MRVFSNTALCDAWRQVRYIPDGRMPNTARPVVAKSVRKRDRHPLHSLCWTGKGAPMPAPPKPTLLPSAHQSTMNNDPASRQAS